MFILETKIRVIKEKWITFKYILETNRAPRTSFPDIILFSIITDFY